MLAALKLVSMPLIVYALCVASGLNPLYTIAAVVCAAVPTAKTVYILASEYKVVGARQRTNGGRVPLSRLQRSIGLSPPEPWIRLR